MDDNPTKILILVEGGERGGDFGQSFAAGFEANQCSVDFLPRQEAWREPYDIVLAYGPFSRATGMTPVIEHLRSFPLERRPIFVWWLTEGIPPLWMPAPLVEIASRARRALDRWGAPDAAHRLRLFGELREAQSLGVLDVLAVTSASRAAYLRRWRFDPIVVPLGYHPDYYGSHLGMARDIDVCFIGNMNAPRRRRLFERVAADLLKRGIAVSVHDNLYGNERTLLLNRSRIILNILRAPQDFVGQRFLLAGANKALVVSEPIRDTEPFVPGKHIVTAPLERLAVTIQHYLAAESERDAIVAEAHRLVTEELTIERMTARILQRAREARGRHFVSAE